MNEKAVPDSHTRTGAANANETYEFDNGSGLSGSITDGIGELEPAPLVAGNAVDEPLADVDPHGHAAEVVAFVARRRAEEAVEERALLVGRLGQSQRPGLDLAVTGNAVGQARLDPCQAGLQLGDSLLQRFQRSLLLLSLRFQPLLVGNFTFTRFFGREAEIAELQRLLLDEGSQLVTLLGPGGSGKTRLAVEAARSEEP